MSWMKNVEVYVPKGACVKNMSFQSLSISMARKIRVHLCQDASDPPEKQMVTWISPVQLRSTAAADSSEVSPLDQRSSGTMIAPGQFWLPVVSSSVKAYKVLRKLLTAHKPPIQLSGPETEGDSQPVTRASSMQKNSLILFNNKIFLSVKKSRGRQASRQNSALASPSPLLSSQNQQRQHAPPSGQTQPLQDTSDRSQQRTAAGTTSDSRDSPSEPPKEPSQGAFILQMSESEPGVLHQSENTACASSEASEEPEAADGGGEAHKRLETTEFLPMVESCLGFDFQLLAKEEKINHLRAQLRQKEAALSVLKSKPTDQV